MLTLAHICKQYITGDLTQKALDDVSLTLRDSEFVAVLGPSGSGKTTLLNIIGGLDRYDSGLMQLNGLSTANYSERDWDTYRSHTIGFVFQSYNLIPHQSILANVELALAISGVGREERRQRAKAALEQVGLGDQLHKRPNQLSGGQMQRVAIARALVNNPDILLADEPTGALDSDTGVQVMELLRQVAADRLVVMVTHNAELAEEYATRIVNLRDGRIVGDSFPCLEGESTLSPAKAKPTRRSSMSLIASAGLSFRNLCTKRGRTLLTAFAGSIGIVGIALILSLSNGVKNYIQQVQKDTMPSYPITLQASAGGLGSLVDTALGGGGSAQTASGTYTLDDLQAVIADENTGAATNDLASFKSYLEQADCPIPEHLGENGIIYTYEPNFSVYTHDLEGTLIHTTTVTLPEQSSSASAMMSTTGQSEQSAGSGMFQQILPGKDGQLISDSFKERYDVLYGRWPEQWDEAVLVMRGQGAIGLLNLYQLGLYPASEYNQTLKTLAGGGKIDTSKLRWSFQDMLAQTFYVVPFCDTYVPNSDGTYTSIAGDAAQLEEVCRSAVRLKISGLVIPAEGTKDISMTNFVGYTSALTDRMIDYAAKQPIVRQQLAQPDRSVLNGLIFAPTKDADKAADAAAYLRGLNLSEKAAFCRTLLQEQSIAGEAESEYLLTLSEEKLAALLEKFLDREPDEALLVQIYDRYISTGSWKDCLKTIGYVDRGSPASISIYTDTFEDKDAVSKAIEEYNEQVPESRQIQYTDYVGILVSSVTAIISVVSYVLIAFVAVSLIVSSIMIGIITYISVLERTKEIGILRAIGASRRNISQVFKAETCFVGLSAGLLGILSTQLILIPCNLLLHRLLPEVTVSASLPLGSAAVLVGLSVLLTLISGLLPARTAARKDPVTALRSE